MTFEEKVQAVKKLIGSENQNSDEFKNHVISFCRDHTKYSEEFLQDQKDREYRFYISKLSPTEPYVTSRTRKVIKKKKSEAAGAQAQEATTE